MTDRDPTPPDSSQDLPRSTSDSTSIESTSPRTDHILRALDFEINRIVAEQREPGWTVWALLGSLATTVWLLFGEWEKGLLTSTRVMGLFLVFSILLDIVINVNALLSQPTGSGEVRGRFRHGTYLTGYRAEMLFGMVRSAVLILIALDVGVGVWWPQVYLIFFFYGIVGAIGAIGFILSFFRLPLPVLPESSSLASQLASWCLVGVIGWVMAGYFFAVLSYPGGVNPSESRVSFLLVVASAVLWLLTRWAKEPPMLSSLVQVRRDLAFGRVDVDTAVRQTDIILAGLHVADALQEELRALMDIYEKANAGLSEAARRLGEAELALAGDLSELSGDERVRITGMIDSARANIRRASDAQVELRKESPKFKWRLAWYVGLSREPDKARTNVLHRIERAAEDLSSSLNELELKTNRLARRLGLDPG